MTLLTGIDPGSHENAVATLDMSGARPRLISWAKLAREELATFVSGMSGNLVIEMVEGVAFDPVRAADLIQTQRAAGGAECVAIASGVRYECLSGRVWRGEWLRFPTASDKAIRIAVEAVVDFADLPRIYAKDRKHIYDAVGVALAAAPRFGLRRVAIPAAAMGQIAEEMSGVRRKSTKKRAATLAKKKAALGAAKLPAALRSKRKAA